MKMQHSRSALKENKRLLGWGLATGVAICWLLLYRLGNLTGGLSAHEVTIASSPVGWHGIYNQALYLPLKLVRSVVFFSAPGHGQTLTRLPNAFFGGLTMITFGFLIRLWHGRRTAVLATALFIFGAWTLHASRLASFDVLYLWSLPALLLSHSLLKKYPGKPAVWCGSIIVWGLLLYIPGLIWLITVDLFLQRQTLLVAWKSVNSWWQRVLYVLLGAIWLPLLVVNLTRPGNLRIWLGLPAHFAVAHTLLKQFVAVPVHLFIRGPQYPEQWLGRAPVLDVFTLLVCVLGIYFYARHRRATRSRQLAAFLFLGWILVALGGPVSLSLLVPLLYMAAATGLAYLLSQWLKVFPNNPLARSLGIGLIVFAVGLSCVYNYRAYFIAWPHAVATRATFQYHR